ncbi:MAG: toxin-antitoxin system YwqK family antitoxin [Bacteroidota bacterium]
MKKVLLFSLSIFIISCGGNQSSTPVAADLGGFSITDFPGGKVQKAMRMDGAGKILEEGEVLDGTKSGTWVTYHPDGNRVKSITNYVSGRKNGLHMEMNDRGQVELQCYYSDDILHGQWTKYKFGSRPEKEVNYKNGNLDGVSKEYHSNGKLQREVNYKDGVQHGSFKQYNDKEELVMEYEYKDGEKVSGGIITPPASADE